MNLPLICAAVALVAGFSSTAWAQVEPNERQKELNKTAYQAMQAGDADAAIAAYEESLAIGELNVTYLNLGRALQKQGECGRAWEAFDAVALAPAVDSPDRVVVQETTNRFTAELAARCPTQIVVSCENEGATVAIDGEFRPCPATFEVDVGPHDVVMTWEVIQREQNVFAGAGRTTALVFRAEAPVAAAPATEPTVEEPKSNSNVLEGLEPPPPALAWGSTAVVASALLFGTSALLDGVIPGWPHYAHDFELTAADFVPAGGYLLSATLLGIGVWKLVTR